MKALLVVDIQKDFCEDGKLEVKEAKYIIPVVNKLIEKYNREARLVVATKDWHPANHKSFASNSNGNIGELGELNGLPQVWWPDHCVQESIGSEFHEELLEIKNIIYKGKDSKVDSYSGFFDNGKTYKTELDDFLKSKNINELDIVGLATDYCVKFTVLDALELGYKVNLITAGCRGVNITETDSKKAIDEMESRGANII